MDGLFTAKARSAARLETLGTARSDFPTTQCTTSPSDSAVAAISSNCPWEALRKSIDKGLCISSEGGKPAKNGVIVVTARRPKTTILAL